MGHRRVILLILALIVGLPLTQALGSAQRRYKTKGVLVSGIPVRDYQFRRYSAHVVSRSAVGLPLTQPGVVVPPVVGVGGNGTTDPRLSKAPIGPAFGPVGAGRGSRRAKFYEFITDPVLAVNHCRLSEMGVTLTEDGDFVVSFVAEQNAPIPAVGTVVVPERITPVVRQTSQILRNRFHVLVRGYVAQGAVLTDPAPIATPAVISFAVDPFWVERGQPLPKRIAGLLPADQARYFDVVDRFEIEFYYEIQDGLLPDIP